MMLKTKDVPSDLLPTAGDSAFYAEHGWWVSGRIFDDDELLAIEEAAKRHQAGDRDRPLPAKISPSLDWTPEQTDGLRVNDFIVYQSSDIHRIALKPIIGAIAARLARTAEVRLFNSSFIEKPPCRPGQDFDVGWHTDRAYWQTCTSTKMLTAWVPMVDAFAENGTLAVLDGSHCWPRSTAVVSLQLERNFASDHRGLIERATSLGVSAHPVFVEVPKGHASFHDCLVFHGSGRNLSRKARSALILHLQDRSNCYQEARHADGTLMVNNNDLMVRRLCHGVPDYSDPEFCPVLWPTPRSH